MSHEFVDKNWRWVVGGLSHPDVIELLAEHQQRMTENSPPESRHVLDIQALQQDNITFWSLWHGDNLLGCVALKQWNHDMAEIKSMKTAPGMTKKGIGKRLLQQVITVAQTRGFQQLKLETGSMDYFKPARNLYSHYGFKYCRPFGDYVDDPNNVFMCLEINNSTD